MPYGASDGEYGTDEIYDGNIGHVGRGIML